MKPSGASSGFPFVQVEGTPFEAGRQHGEQLGDRIAVSIDHYQVVFREKLGLDWADALEAAGRLEGPTREHAPDLMEEMEGIAAGSQTPVNAILALNARTGILRMTPEGARWSPTECTTGAALPSSTANGHTIAFGNWDQHVRCLDNTVVVELRITGRPAVMMFTEAGVLMRTGLNSSGLGITGNALACDRDGKGLFGVPSPVVRRRVLQHDKLAPAVRELYSAQLSHSGNHVLADAEGFAVDLEVTPGEVFAIVPEDGLLVHSNHFVSPAAISKVVDLSVGRSGSTLYRKHRVDEILRARAGEVGSTDIEEALSDHFGRPESVCAHTGESRPVGQTIASHISDLTTRTLRVSSGPPCMNPYVDYQLT